MFLAICSAQFYDGRTFGISKGEVLEIRDNNVTCFGPEHQFEADVLLDFFKEKQITIQSTYLSNKLKKGDIASFIYWGPKKEIQTSFQSLETNNKSFTSVKIALLTYDSWISWYYIFFLITKWWLLLSGSFLLMMNKKWK